VNRLFLVLLAIPALARGAPPDWQENLSPAKPGPFPNPPALKVNYRMGWLKFNSGFAEGMISRPRPDMLELDVSGGSTGLARKIWKLDATGVSLVRAATLHPIRVKQTEDYGWDKIVTDVTFTGKSAGSLRNNHEQFKPEALEKPQFSFPNIYDLFSALLYVRSQQLQPGDDLNLVVFPAKSPYLVTIRVAGSEHIQVAAGKYNAIKLDIRLQKITPQRGLEPHPECKHLVAWISDDEDRILLRAESETFVGSVWMELQSVKITGR
jgi:hypothetical protein